MAPHVDRFARHVVRRHRLPSRVTRISRTPVCSQHTRAASGSIGPGGRALLAAQIDVPAALGQSLNGEDRHGAGAEAE
jgi:hypothetical protein